MLENSDKPERKKHFDTGEGKFFYIEILHSQEYKRFRIQNVSEKTGIERVRGQRANGLWETIKWIISKEIAHAEDGKLVADSEEAQELFDKIGIVPQHIEGNRYGIKAHL